VAVILGEALAVGRLTSEEHAERLEAVYAARTYGELEPITRDLPKERTGAVVLPDSTGAGCPDGTPSCGPCSAR